MIVRETYICQKCGASFRDKDECEKHESKHNTCVCQARGRQSIVPISNGTWSFSSNKMTHSVMLDLNTGEFKNNGIVIGHIDYCPYCGKYLYGKERAFMINEAKKRRDSLHRELCKLPSCKECIYSPINATHDDPIRDGQVFVGYCGNRECPHYHKGRFARMGGEGCCWCVTKKDVVKQKHV